MNESSKSNIHVFYRVIQFFRKLLKKKPEEDDTILKKPIIKKRSPFYSAYKELELLIKENNPQIAEKHFVKILMDVQRKVFKHKNNFRINGHYQVIMNYHKKAEDSDIIYTGFMLLKDAYIREGKNKDALRMLEIASIFKKPGNHDIQWALSTATRENINKGFWLGEASHLYASNNKDENCRKLLEESARQGNEFSRFILNNRQ